MLDLLTASAVGTSNTARESWASAGRLGVGLKQTGKDLKLQETQWKKSHVSSCMKESNSDDSFLDKKVWHPHSMASYNDKDCWCSEAQKSSKYNVLRINPGHILCDADHDGGIVIQLLLELPQGLRHLFLALNKDERT
jgi:hypothetical protein